MVRFTRSAGAGDAVVVLGLGRFGEAVALELAATGTEVLGIDTDERKVQQVAGVLTHAVIADSTDEEAMRQLSVHEFDRAVVGIGDDLESSILTVSLLVQLGVGDVWAKAISEPHARILGQIGCHHIVRPEFDIGRRVAHLVAGRMLDYIAFDDDFVIVKMRPPAMLLDRSLTEAGVRAKYAVTIVGVKSPGSDFTHAIPETVVRAGDTIIVSGLRERVESFADLTAS